MEDFGTNVDSQEAMGAPNEGEPSQPAEAGNEESQPAQNGSFDQISAQSDYSRKTQELAEQRKEVERLKEELQQTLSQAQQGGQWNGGYGQNGYGAQNGYQQPYQQPYYQAPQQPIQPQEYVDLVDQFGEQGASSVVKLLQKVTGEINTNMLKQQYETAYATERAKLSAKYGEDAMSKHDYRDPKTGALKNKVVDGIAKGYSVEKAWNAENPVDAKKLEQELRDKIYAEINQKSAKTPVSNGSSKPSSSGNGHVGSLAEALAQAEEQLGQRLA